MHETRWLTDGEQRAWRAYLGVTALLPTALDHQLQRDSAISHASYIVLAMLSEAPGRALRMSELASRANSSQSRLSHTVARLEERGWVRRQRADEDRRGNVATLTDAGWDLVVAAAPGHVAAVRQYLFDALTPEQVGQLEEIFTTVLDVLDPAGTCPGHPAGDQPVTG